MSKTISQSILSIFLASMLLFGAITIASNSNFGNTMMTTMQSAEADQFDDLVATQVNSCDEFGDGDDLDNCQNNINSQVDPITQTPGTGTSNLFNEITTSQQLNDCDESDPGNNEAFCSNDADYFVGPTEQTNNPSVNPVGSNVVNIVIDDDMVNNCDESGANGGTNFADCDNVGETDVGGNNGVTEGITQNNFAIATDNLDNPNFAEVNTVDTFQRMDLLNTCTEMQVDAADNFCSNDADNFIGPVGQSNIVIGEIPEQPHTNNFAASQIATAQNDCDESGGGASFSLFCDNGDDDADNVINSVLQDNTATNTDNAVQTNDATSLQSVDLLNDCNETEDGDNTAECDVDAINIVNPIEQSNEALGHQDATIFQNNEIDGNDVGDIPGINQVITADNTCDEIGVGTNFGNCDLGRIDNIIAPVDQTNLVNEADSATDIFQDNRGVISQVIDAHNDCDETGIGGGDNDADCNIEENLDNILAPLNQENVATGADNSLFDQDNNVDVSQSLVAENDCNASGNSAFCLIGDEIGADINVINGINQESTSELSGDAFSNQLNEVGIDQNANLVNTCDESGTGLNDVECRNLDISNLVQTITQQNEAFGEDSAVISETSNKVDIIQNLQATNDCDESNAGANLMTCENEAFNTIGLIAQTNTADGSGVDDIDQDNFVSINQNLQSRNDCDESGDGDNNGNCLNTAVNSIDSVIQTNDAVGDGDDIVDQDNILEINQNVVTENDCDEFGLGNNLVDCGINISNEIGHIIQDNTDSDTGTTNSLTINQDLQAKNNCDDSTSGDNTKICTIDLHLEVPDITQQNGEVLTINQNDVAINTCPGGGTCDITRTTTFVPLSFSSSQVKLPTEELEGSIATATTSAFVQEAEADADVESQSSPLNNEGDDDDGDNSSPSGNNDNNNVDDTSAKLSAAETETSIINEEEEEQQDETDGDGAPEGAEPEGEDTGNENQNNNNNNDDDDGNDNDNDNDDQNNTNNNNNNNNNNNDNEGGEEGEEEEDDEPEDDEPEEGGDEEED